MASYSVTTTTLQSISNNNNVAVKQKPKGVKYFFGEFATELKFGNIIYLGVFHVIAAYTFLTFPYLEKYKTLLWGLTVAYVGAFGVTAGVHRYWTHRTFEAKLPLQILLAICYSMAGHNPITEWVRDHRVHHKYSETDADPHNSNRGFFFAHVGWLFMRKHPEVIRRGREMDMSDIYNDPLVQFHTKYFIPLQLFFCFILPTVVPVYCWNETWYYAIMSQCFARYVYSLNATWSVNSAAHLFGYKPYDVKINPTENLFVSIVAFGEGWHNFHHTFPWDYRASEYGRLNMTLYILNFFKRIGWAYDMKEVSDNLIELVQKKRANKSIHLHENLNSQIVH